MTARATARGGAAALALLTGLAVTASGATAHASSPPRAATDQVKAGPAGDPLDLHARKLLDQAQAAGKTKVTVMLATAPGQTAAVVATLKARHNFVGYVNDKLGYVRATVYTNQIERTAKLRGVQALDLNEKIQQPDPKDADGGPGFGGRITPTGPAAPPSNPYLPTNETGAVAFTQAHPEYDGRGTTIGILDSGVDLDHPDLQKTSTGERKIVDWVTAVDPLLEGDGSWRPMLTTVTGPTFTAAGRTWTAPPGTWKFNTFAEAITKGSEPAGDVNRDGDTTDTFGILYNPTTNDIYVDDDQDGNFTNDVKMRPYNEKFQVGHFGKDNPATEVVETFPYVVEFRKDVDLTPAGLANQKADFVNIGIVEDAHGSHVAGIAAANTGRGAEGAAPGAKIVSSRACTWGGGCTAVALTEGMIDLVANRHVDVVNMSIGGLPALNDGNNVRSKLYDRLIDTYGVELFISAGNSGPGVNTVGDPSVATKVVSVGSEISKDTWLANYGSVVDFDKNLHTFSSRGPREDGGFKPNIVAPGSAISSVPRWLKQPDVATAGYTLPIGYAMFNGTSMASPQAAGAAALMLSAAKATGSSATPAQLRKAIYSTAGLIPGVPAFAQGTGLINVPRAWDLLKQNLATYDYTVDAPVCTPISEFLATPNRGTGIYNRCGDDAGGQRIGETRTYPVTITRTTGPAGSLAHQLRWVGNDGTFTVAGSADLPLGTPVTVPITATPDFGAHGAVLELDDPSSPGVEGFSLHTVVAAADFSKPSYNLAASGVAKRNLSTSYFVNVPAGAKALQVDLSGIVGDSQTRWVAINPYGLPVDSTDTRVCYTNYSGPVDCDATSRAYLDPLPGVWEIEVESRRTSPLLDNPYTISAAIQGVTVSPPSQTVPSVTLGTPGPVNFQVTNNYGPVTGRVQGGPLGSARSLRPSIGTGDTLTYDVVVPAGATRFDAAIGNTSDLAADLDLYVYLGGKVVGQSADGDSEEAVSLTNPKPGTYTVEVDGYDVPAGTTQFDYLDVFFSPALGSLSVPDIAATLQNGQTIDVPGQVTVLAPAASGRELFGEMQAVSQRGAVLGRGTVLIGSVAGAPAPSPTAGPTGTPGPTPPAPTSSPSPTGSPTVSPTPSLPPAPTPTSTVGPTPTSTVAPTPAARV